MFSFKLDEGVLEGIASLPVPDDLTLLNRAKPAKDQFKVMLLGDRIQLAYEEDILRGLHIGIREVL